MLFFIFAKNYYIVYVDCCSDPRARPDLVDRSEPKPQGRPFNFFLFTFYYVFFFKGVATRIPGSTRRAGPNRSPVYFDVFIYLIKHLFMLYHFRFSITRKHFQMGGP